MSSCFVALGKSLPNSMPQFPYKESTRLLQPGCCVALGWSLNISETQFPHLRAEACLPHRVALRITWDRQMWTPPGVCTTGGWMVVLGFQGPSLRLALPPYSRAFPLQQRPPCELVALPERACSNCTAGYSSQPQARSLCSPEALYPLLQPRATPLSPQVWVLTCTLTSLWRVLPACFPLASTSLSSTWAEEYVRGSSEEPGARNPGSGPDCATVGKGLFLRALAVRKGEHILLAMCLLRVTVMVRSKGSLGARSSASSQAPVYPVGEDSF